MNWFVKGLIKPTDNRHHAGGKVHRYVLYITSTPLVALVCFVGYSRFGLMGAFLGFVLGALTFILSDKAYDYLGWHLIYRKMGFSEHDSKRRSEKEFLADAKKETVKQSKN